MTESLLEINIDGMIGPTHHFGGLGVGNLASLSSQNEVSNPREAALEGIAKMELLAGLGIDQFYLPPLERPNWRWLESIGFAGERGDVLRRCLDEAPSLLSAAYSSAFMWTANAATVAPSCDTVDGKLHIGPANLCSNLHRGQEATERRDQLRTMFGPIPNAQVHEPLPSVVSLRDEGAANHMRLCDLSGQKAVHVFVHGPGESRDPNPVRRTKFLSRQTELASRRIASCLQLRKEDCLFVEQTECAIDAGVFHNDVIAMSHGNLLIYHEHAFAGSANTVELIREKFFAKTGQSLIALCVSESELTLHEAVRTYLFNSQLVSLETQKQRMELICPSQCEASKPVQALLKKWIKDDSIPIESVRFLSLDQSMRNGGGPACLRLRVTLSREQIKSLGTRFLVTDPRIADLISIVKREYPDSLCLGDLASLEFAEHARKTAQAIESIS